MSRRQQRPELEFGSDSFLDVVCNIVGILIILIVVVAVKVQRQPPIDPAVLASATVVSASPDLSAAIADIETQIKSLTIQQQARQQEIGDTTAADEAQARMLEDLLTEQQLLNQEQDLTRTTEAARTAELSELEQQHRIVVARTAALQQLIDEQDQNALKTGELLTSVTRERDAVTRNVRDTTVETVRLQEALQHAQQTAAPKDRLEHRLSPVSRTVLDEEIFFRVEKGRVSKIPIAELMERLKAQIRSKSAAIVRFSQFEGTVGPVEGYRMNYAVEKSGETSLDELIWGDGRISISVRQWTIVPEPTIPDESIEEALRPGSRFRQVVETVPPEQTITMWVYPDSFASFAPLRDVAHGLQLRVAARPMPAGTPIVGSPNGSKSSAQ